MRLDRTRALLVMCLLCALATTAAANAPEAAIPDDTEPGASFSIEQALEADWRDDADRARDRWRHPREVLEFVALAPGQTVVEISPGRGWYTKILAPYVNRTGGKYIAAGFDPEDEREYAQRGRQAFQDGFVDQSATYGPIEVTVLGPNSEGIAAPGSADLVLTFRNVHNWVPAGYADKVFADMFRALRPGGVLGVVDHRLPEDREADEKLSTGYIHEASVIELAEGAGFVFESRSDINDNPKDTSAHPFGVWTLPPTALSAGFGKAPDDSFDRGPYDAIGESDRFTLRFRKPTESD